MVHGSENNHNRNIVFTTFAGMQICFATIVTIKGFNVGTKQHQRVYDQSRIHIAPSALK